MYGGRAKRGVAAVAAALVLGVGLLALSLSVGAAWLRVFCMVLALAAPVAVAVDAYRVARRTRATGFTPPRYDRWYVYVGVWIVAAFLVWPLIRAGINRYVVEAHRVPTGAMSPTIIAGDLLLSAPLSSRQPLRRTMPVIFRDPTGTFISRIAGVPGDTLQMRAKRLYVNGEPQTEPFAQWIDAAGDPADPSMLWQRGLLVDSVADYAPTRDDWGPIVIPPATYFMLGDNRDNSQDSRYDGVVSRDRIVQRPVWIYFSRDRVMGETRWDRIGRSIQ